MVVLTMIGQKILLNNFIAIWLENFDEGAIRQKMHKFEEKKAKKGLMHSFKNALMSFR
jgi:hypothetical protein